MKCMLITQYSLLDVDRNEISDVLDKNWHSLCLNYDYYCLPCPNNLQTVKEITKRTTIDGIIFSGRGGFSAGYSDKVPNAAIQEVANERDAVERYLYNFAKDNDIPLMGVCRGMQHINLIENGGIVSCANHVNRRHMIKFERITGLPSFLEVNSYHNFAITKDCLATTFEVTAKCDDVIEMIKYRNKDIYGVMWHPEREDYYNARKDDAMQVVFG